MNSKITVWLEEKISLPQRYSKPEEMANGITHAIGIVLSILAGFFLLQKAAGEGSSITTVGYIIFSLSMLTLYASSSFYHFLPVSNLKRVARIMDHMSIYLLIAGTYTPIMIALQNSTGYTILIAVWAIGIIGMILKIIFWGRFGFFHVLFYIIMGWMVVFGWRTILATLPTDFFLWILAGGITYTLGTIAYAMKNIPYAHAIWHLFVLGGTIFFFISVYKFA